MQIHLLIYSVVESFVEEENLRCRSRVWRFYAYTNCQFVDCSVFPSPLSTILILYITEPQLYVLHKNNQSTRNAGWNCNTNWKFRWRLWNDQSELLWGIDDASYNLIKIIVQTQKNIVYHIQCCYSSKV